MELEQLHRLASDGDFAGALEAAENDFGSMAANLEAACVAAWCLSRLGRNEEAFDAARTTHQSAERDLGPNHPVTLEALNDYARFSARCGRLAEAVEAGARVLEMRRTSLGEHHPKTLTSWGNLIGYRHQAGEQPASEETNALLRAWQGIDPGLQDRAHLAAMLQVAETRRDHTLAAGALEQYVQLLGEDHPDTLRAREALSSLV